MQNGCFPCEIALRLKVCYKVSLCDNCQLHSCKAFVGLTICEKNDWWETSPSIWRMLTHLFANHPFSISFSL